MFNRKRIRELEAALAEQTQRAAAAERSWADANRREEALRNQVTYLVSTIRKIDDIIFSISQSADGSWKTVQPRFKQLHDGMIARKEAENNRISGILHSELVTAYTPPMIKDSSNGQ